VLLKSHRKPEILGQSGHYQVQKGQFLTCVGSLQVFKAEHFTLSENNTVVKMNKIQVLTVKMDFYSKIMN
jgi:hypothetical protein